jgi:hypothetical protein
MFLHGDASGRTRLGSTGRANGLQCMGMATRLLRILSRQLSAWSVDGGFYLPINLQVYLMRLHYRAPEVALNGYFGVRSCFIDTPKIREINHGL